MRRTRIAVLLVSLCPAAALAAPLPAAANHSSAGDSFTDCQMSYPSSWVWIRPPTKLAAVNTTSGIDWQTIYFNVELWYANANTFQWERAGTSANFLTSVNEGGWAKGKKRRGKKRKRRWVPAKQTTNYWVHQPTGWTKQWAARWNTKFDVSVYSIANISWVQNGKTVHSERWKLRALNYRQAGSRQWGWECYQYNPYGSGTGAPWGYTANYWE
jgi:hypothetical protein